MSGNVGTDATSVTGNLVVMKCCCMLFIIFIWSFGHCVPFNFNHTLNQYHKYGLNKKRLSYNWVAQLKGAFDYNLQLCRTRSPFELSNSFRCVLIELISISFVDRSVYCSWGIASIEIRPLQNMDLVLLVEFIDVNNFRTWISSEGRICPKSWMVSNYSRSILAYNDISFIHLMMFRSYAFDYARSNKLGAPRATIGGKNCAKVVQVDEFYQKCHTHLLKISYLD